MLWSAICPSKIIQTWGFKLLEALCLETLLLRSVKNMEITVKNTITDNAQTAIIHILEDPVILLDLCICDTVVVVLSKVFFLGASMDPTFALLVLWDDSCAILSFF